MSRQPLLEHKKKHFSWPVHVTGETCRLVAGTEVKIGTLKAADSSQSIGSATSVRPLERV